MRLETNLENIARIAKNKEEENKTFCSFLERQNFDEIDDIVHRLNSEISSRINCVDCGNCCLNVRPTASYAELSKFVEPKNIEAYKYLPSIKCRYLDNKKCTIYTDRYDECRLYPGLHKDEVVSRTYGVLQSYGICPIILNVFEYLKTELGWSFSK